ncbi:MAG: hypothetical protein ACLQIB_53430 [Isosphaeraceae bacterium]
MAVASRSLYKSWVPLGTIVGAMLVAGAASAYDTTGKRRCAAACGATCAGSPVPPENSTGSAQTPLAMVNRLAGPAAVNDCFKTNDGPCLSSSEPPVSAGWRSGHRIPKTHPARAARTVRVVFDLGVRLKRVQSGSTLCCSDHFPAYFVTMPADDPSDDTTSDDPDDDDDNDTSKFLNGYDETDFPSMAWLPERAAFPILPERTLVTRAPHLASTLLHILQRLRC